MRRYLVAALAVLLAACGGDADFRTVSADRAEEGAASAELESAVSRSAPAPQDPVADMVVRSGRARVEVEALEPAVEAVRALADRLGGYTADVSVRMGREERREATLEVRVPAASFDSAIGGLSSLGEVEAVTVTAEDVAEEYVDVQAQVANGRRLEQRLLELLAERTGDLDDVLAVERELARVRERIDRQEGRLRYLRDRVSMSTLVVTVHEPSPLVASYRGESVIGGAVRSMWRNFVLVVAGMIAALGFLVPLGAVAALVWLGVRRVRRRV